MPPYYVRDHITLTMMMHRRHRIPNSLEMAYWNANGLACKQNELREFAERYDLDVILVCETHLRAGDKPRLPNYRFYRNDRVGARGGGTAIFVRTSLDHYEDLMPPLEHLEATAIVVKTLSGSVRLVAAYNPPNRQLLEGDLTGVLDTDKGVVLAGDLNAKHPSWNSRIANANGRILRSFTDETGILTDAPTDHTFYPSSERQRSDVLDVVVIKDVRLVHRVTTLNELSSDHLPVLLQLGDVPDPRVPVERSTVSWPAFTDHLQHNMGPIRPIRNAQELDEAVERLTGAIEDSLRYATNKMPVRDRRWVLPAHIRELMRERERVRRSYQRSWDPDLKRRYNRLRDQVRKELAEFRNASFDARLDALNAEDDQSCWKIVKVLKGSSPRMPPIHGESGMAITPEEKVEAHADNLEIQCSPLCDDDEDENFIDRVERIVSRRLDEENVQQIEHASPTEVKEAIQRCKSRKASGPDGIGNAALKALPLKAVVSLTGIINATLRLRHFPTKWKCADVVVLPKPKANPTFPQNYRPISLLPCLGKVCERIVQTRLQRSVQDLNLIQDEQFGFRPKHSTVHQVLRLVEYIADGFNRNQSTAAVFFDVAKAFDKVWHEGLLFKMLEAGVPLGLVQLVASYLTGRKARIKLNGTRSRERILTAGVPQGSLLSPILYCIFVSDLPRTEGTQLAMYADDVCIYSRSWSPEVAARRLQVASESLLDYFATWRVKINADKSTAVLFTRRRRRPPDAMVLQGNELPWLPEAKYLGVVLDSKLTWKSHIELMANRAKAALVSLYALINRRSKLDPLRKIRLYKAVIRPTMTYAASVWGYAARSHVQKLQVVQNKVLRMAFDAPWFVSNETLHNDSQMVTIEEFIRVQASTEFARLETHPNPLLEGLMDYDAEHLRHKRPRMILSQ